MNYTLEVCAQMTEDGEYEAYYDEIVDGKLIETRFIGKSWEDLTIDIQKWAKKKHINVVVVYHLT